MLDSGLGFRVVAGGGLGLMMKWYMRVWLELTPSSMSVLPVYDGQLSAYPCTEVFFMLRGCWMPYIRVVCVLGQLLLPGALKHVVSPTSTPYSAMRKVMTTYCFLPSLKDSCLGLQNSSDLWRARNLAVAPVLVVALCVGSHFLHLQVEVQASSIIDQES